MLKRTGSARITPTDKYRSRILGSLDGLRFGVSTGTHAERKKRTDCERPVKRQSRSNALIIKSCSQHAALTMLVLCIIVFGLTSCASTDRLPAVPLALASKTQPLDIPDARFYTVGDTDKLLALAEKVYVRRSRARLVTKTSSVLAISGGGDDGAFGGGLLTGWRERGDRPEFDTVTGISTGALSAPFAFLGPEYDSALRKIYTDTDADDVFSKRTLLAVVASDAMADTAPLRAMIARFVDRKMIMRIAEQYQRGRLLLIMTTNLDQGRAVIWNIGAIAESGHPHTRQLIIDILLASASLPGVFPPVMLDINIDGKRYQEMHVDGGAIAQAFLYPPSLSFKKVKEILKADGLKFKEHKRVAYILRNGRLYRPEANVKRSTLAILTQTTTTMTAASGVNDTYRIYLTTKRDGVGFNLAYIDDDFTLPYKGPFDKGYMRALFDYGFQKGFAGYPWQTTPPGYQE